MGRKYPKPKRQFGVKDPLKQREEREEKIKDKINNPPKNFEDQEISKSFKKFIKLKNETKKGKIVQKFTNVNTDFKSTKIDMDKMKKHENESDYKFLKRVNRITHQRRMEAEFSAKYNVDIDRNQETGEIKLKKRKKNEVDEIDEMMKKKRDDLKKGMKKRLLKNFEDEKNSEKPQKLTTLQKMKLKKLEKEIEKKKEKKLEFAEYQHEEIKFGERVTAPPSLIVPKRAIKLQCAARPGQRDLLLTQMLNPESAETVKATPKTFVKKGPVDKKGKRKNLPNSTRIALENERMRAVELYRQSKKNPKQPFIPMSKKNLDDFE